MRPGEKGNVSELIHFNLLVVPIQNVVNQEEQGCDPNKDAKPASDPGEDAKLGSDVEPGAEGEDPNWGEQNQDMPPADEPTSEGNDPNDIRNLLRTRPQSLVLLAAHRMVGIFGRIGGHNTIDTAEAPQQNGLPIK